MLQDWSDTGRPEASRPTIVGIVNITPDSFSDGGLHLAPDAAIAHAKRLWEGGADLVELGAASSNPDAARVGADEEIARLSAVLAAVQSDGIPVSIDTTEPDVQRFAVAHGVDMLNDIRGFPDPAIRRELAAASCSLVVMHSIDQDYMAQRRPTNPDAVFASACAFFRTRLAELDACGIPRERIILDPGMGFFLGSNAGSSLAMLRRLGELSGRFGQPLFVSVSRKSFLRNLPPTDGHDIQARTLAAELYAAAKGVAYIRTHDAKALRQAITTVRAIAGWEDVP